MWTIVHTLTILAILTVSTAVTAVTAAADTAATAVEAVAVADSASGSHTRVRPIQWMKSVDERIHAGFGSALAASEKEYLLVGAEGQGAGT
jgi:hypothetical protein